MGQIPAGRVREVGSRLLPPSRVATVEGGFHAHFPGGFPRRSAGAPSLASTRAAHTAVPRTRGPEGGHVDVFYAGRRSRVGQNWKRAAALGLCRATAISSPGRGMGQISTPGRRAPEDRAVW